MLDYFKKFFGDIFTFLGDIFTLFLIFIFSLMTILISPVVIIFLLFKTSIYRFTKGHKEVLYGEIIEVGKDWFTIKYDENTHFIYYPYVSYLYFKKPPDLSNFFVGQKVSFHLGVLYGDNWLLFDVRNQDDDHIKVEGYMENFNASKLINNDDKGNIGSVCFYVNNFPKSFNFYLFSLEMESLRKLAHSTFGQKCTALLNKKTGEIKNMEILSEMHELVNKDELVKDLKDVESKNNFH